MIAYVHSGDTIILLAQRHLGSSLRWRELATLNNLDAPYIADNPAPHRAQGLTVLGPGDTLTLPGMPPGTPLDAEEQTYGIDLGWDQAHYAAMVEAGIWHLDRGVRNLAKAIYRRLVTRYGELPAHPDYGSALHEHLGEPASRWRAQLAATDAKHACLQDNRVQAVEAEAEYLPNGELRVTLGVTPIPPGQTFMLPIVIHGGGRG